MYGLHSLIPYLEQVSSFGIGAVTTACIVSVLVDATVVVVVVVVVVAALCCYQRCHCYPYE